MNSPRTIGLLAMLLITIAATVWVMPAVTSDLRPPEAQTASANRQAIQQMPILERPSRVGHFYGNTVRRRYSRQSG